MKEDDTLIPQSEENIPGSDQIPQPLQKFYDAFSEAAPGYYDKNNYVSGFGLGIENVSFGPVTITVDNIRISVIDTAEYVSSEDKNMRLITIQGYAQLSVFDRFYASCILIGQADPVNLNNVLVLVDHLSKTEEEREAIKKKEIDEVTIHPSFYASVYNDPLNEAESTCGIYIISDREQGKISCDTVLQAMGIADFADNTFFGLAIGVRANINTFKKSMNFSVAASVRFADSERFSVAGELGLLNGKINSISISLKVAIPVCTSVYLTQVHLSVKGFQEPKIAVGFGCGMAFGEKIGIPEGLSVLKKALFPNLNSFYPLELSLNGEINPARSYYSATGKGVFIGNIAISASITWDNKDIDAEIKAATVRNSYLSGSLSAAFHKREDNWSLHGNFNCSVSLDWKNLVGLSVSGGIDILFCSQDYTMNNARYNRKDLTVTVSGMGKFKLFCTFSVSVQKTWVFNLSNTQISEPKLLMKSVSDGSLELDDRNDVFVCESEDIAEIQLPQHRSIGVIDSKSWQIEEKNCSTVAKFQIAAQYTLAGSTWRLVHSSGDVTTVYTPDNSAGIVSLQEFTHNYYELLVNVPSAGYWTLEIMGDSQTAGKLYMDALCDEKIITELKILEETDSAIRFAYSAYTAAGDDEMLVRLFAEEISGGSDDQSYSGLIAYLEETENGEFVWEIPDEFRNNANYRFYVSAASSAAAEVQESNSVEVTLERQEAKLNCAWELFYSADNTDIVTACITVTNSGANSTIFQWELLDYTNNDTINPEDISLGNTSQVTEIIASGKCIEIQGNSTLTFQEVITITDKLRDNPSALQLTVKQCSINDTTLKNEDNEDNEDNEEAEEISADDTDDIIFTAMDSMYCKQVNISWQAVEGAASYVLQYALEGDWEEGGVYVNNITDTSYTMSVAPGTYYYRFIAMDSNQQAIGTWSEETLFDVLFTDEQILNIEADNRKSRSQAFSLNDGIYDFSGTAMENFTGTLTLYRNDLVQTDQENDSSTIKFTEKKIITLKFVNGSLVKLVSPQLLDNGDYFWEWKRSGNAVSTESEIKVQILGEIFSIEQQDRECVNIGGDDSDIAGNHLGHNVETLEGEVGFCNKDTIYQYITDEGGELSLTIANGTVLEKKVKIHVYVQNSRNTKYSCIKTLTVNAGEYAADTLILDQLTINNNFYIQVVSWDNGKGKYNTNYSFDLSFNAFKDNVQTTDILEIDGDAVTDWVGHRNEAHSYLLQVDKDDLYAIKLQGDAGDAVLKICNLKGKVIQKMQIQANGVAQINNVYLESGNYFVMVESKDKGKGKYNTDYVLSASRLQTLYPEIDNSNDTWQNAALQEGTAVGECVEDWLGIGDATDFFKITVDPDREISSSFLAINLDEKTAQAVEDGILKIICRNEAGQSLAIRELDQGQLVIKKEISGSEVYIGVSLKKTAEDIDYSFSTSWLASI